MSAKKTTPKKALYTVLVSADGAGAVECIYIYSKEQLKRVLQEEADNWDIGGDYDLNQFVKVFKGELEPMELKTTVTYGVEDGD